MVRVAGRSILEHQVAALRSAGVDEIVVVRGYLGDRITVPGLRFYENQHYMSNNILASLFCAEEAMDEGFVFSYSDILYDETVTRALMEAQGDYRLVVDKGWQSTYEGRKEHPISEGELTLVEGGVVRRVGKGLVAPESTAGEFIGLAYFSEKAARMLKEEYAHLKLRLGGRPGQPFGTAPAFEKAYLTDMLNHLIERGVTMTPVFINGHWREIDTVEDLERARRDFGE